MGCCGCDNRTSANTAGIFGIVQCIIGIILAIYNLSIFYGSCYLVNSGKDYLCLSLWGNIGSIRALLIVLIIIYVIWLLSSIVLLIGNANDRAGHVRQWVIISTIVIICDVLLPGILVGLTFGKIINVQTSSITGRTYPSNNSLAVDMNLTWNYMVLVITFTRGGIITWFCDIALTVFTSRRATEIENPPRAYVYTNPIIAVPQPYAVGVPYTQQGLVAATQPTYFGQQQYPLQQGGFQSPQQQGGFQSPQQQGGFQNPQVPTNMEYMGQPPPSYSPPNKGDL